MQYRYVAGLNWIEAVIQLATTSTSRKLIPSFALALGLPKGCVPYVRAVDGDEGGASRWRFRIRSPESGGHLVETVSRLRSALGPACLSDFTVSGLGLYFDTYVASASRSQLAAVAADRLKSRPGTARSAERWRICADADENPAHGAPPLQCMHRMGNDMAWRLGELRESLEAGYPLTDDVPEAGILPIRRYLQVMSFDDDGARLIELSQPEWRIRLGVILRNDALPSPTIESLPDVDFAALAHHFRCDRAKGDSDDSTGQRASEGGGRASRAGGRKAQQSGLLYRGASEANVDLDAMVKAALQDLTAVWQATARRRVA